MASKRRLRRKSCGRKIGHDSQARAEDAIAMMKFTKGKLYRPGLVPYRCRHCGKWHVGHIDWGKRWSA